MYCSRWNIDMFLMEKKNVQVSTWGLKKKHKIIWFECRKKVCGYSNEFRLDVYFSVMYPLCIWHLMYSRGHTNHHARTDEQPLALKNQGLEKFRIKSLILETLPRKGPIKGDRKTESKWRRNESKNTKYEVINIFARINVILKPWNVS